MRFLPNVSRVWGGARKKKPRIRSATYYYAACTISFRVLICWFHFLRSFVRLGSTFCATQTINSVRLCVPLGFGYDLSTLFLYRFFAPPSFPAFDGRYRNVCNSFFVIYFSFIGVLYYTSVVRFFSFLPRPQLATIFARV